MTKRLAVLVVVPSRLVPWHADVVRSLEAVADVDVTQASGAEVTGPTGLLTRLYARLDRWPRPPVAATEAPRALSRPVFDVVVDLADQQSPGTAGVPILRPIPTLLDEGHVLAVLLAGKSSLTLEVHLDGRGSAASLAATSTVGLARLSARRSSQRLGARMAALVVRSVERLSNDAQFEPASPAPALPTWSRLRLARLVADALVTAAKVAVTRVDWRVSWGRVASPDPFAVPSSLETIAAPAGHFYADPFVVETDEGTFVFVEDFDLALGRATIAVVNLSDGSATTVVTADGHLSYPFVFQSDGTWYMIPESASAHEIVLLRCESFPSRWSRDTLLLDGIVAYDATLLRHDDLWWMFFASGSPGGTSDDELHLWFSDSFRGPFEPHPRNPIVSHVGSARPAGRVVVDSGRILRPAQDSSQQYGGAIVVQEVTQLSRTEYRERPFSRIGPDLVAAGGIHTINRAGAVVAIDTKHRVPRRPGRAY
jgi:hypothetical protein